MAIHTEALAADVVAQAAADAILQVQDEIVDLSAAQGRAGVIASLRSRSAELSNSAIAFDQIKTRALEQAADDIAWGRPPLSEWSIFLDEESRPSTAQRLALRLQVGPPEVADAEIASGLCRAIEARVRAEAGDECCVARLPRLLRREQMLHEALWDDPRVPATPEIRRHMRAAGRTLKRKLVPSAASESPPAHAAAPGRPGFWRRLIGRLQAFAGLRRPATREAGGRARRNSGASSNQ